MPSGSVRRVSREDIQLVQNLIERCLQLYMNQKEVVDTLLDQAKIEPDFTSLVWQKLEEENQEFFKAYYLRLLVKQQIVEFNRLLDQQMQLMHQIRPPPPTAGAPISTSNGSHISPLHQGSGWNASEHALKPESMNPFSNGRSSIPSSGMHSGVDMVARLDAPRAMLSAQNSNSMSVMQGMNGGGGIVKPEAAARTIVKSESGYSNTSPYSIFGGAGNNVILEGRPNLGDASVAPFGGVVVDSNSQPLNESLLDPDTTSFGFLGQIPRNFSLSDLTADFSQSTDILESYSRSPFLPPDAEDFLDSRERDPQGDNKRLDTISEGLSYEDFGSE